MPGVPQERKMQTLEWSLVVVIGIVAIGTAVTV